MSGRILSRHILSHHKRSTLLALLVAISALWHCACTPEGGWLETWPLAIKSQQLAGATEGDFYAYTIEVTGGVEPLTWTLKGGALPPDMEFDDTTGTIFGTVPTPSDTGQYRFTISVTDSADPPVTSTRVYILTVAPATFPSCSTGDTSLGFPPLDNPELTTYLDEFETGLYPGSNVRPWDHEVDALEVEPLDTSGEPSDTGSYVLLSVGMSNPSEEFCCAAYNFIAQAEGDEEVNSSALVILNGAADSQTATFWDSPDDRNYDRVLDDVLTPEGLDEPQVEVVWLKVANPFPTVALPDSDADAYTLLGDMGNIVRALKSRYVNLKQVFLSSRIYAGYATHTLNPEPYAYETGLAVKWLIQAQIDQMNGADADAIAGDLDYTTVAPWLSWGPYLWADGQTPRASDGSYWTCGDYLYDGTHPDEVGREKVANELLVFFKNDAVARRWFLADP